MKFKVVVLIGVVLISMLAPAFSKNNPEPKDLAVSNYVVIGAFAVYANATSFAVKTNQKEDQWQLMALYDLNPDRNLFYVYVLSTQDQEAAVRMANRIRSETPFKDAWVFHGLLGKRSGGENAITKGVDINPATANKIETVQPVDQTSGVISNPNENTSAKNTTITVETKTTTPLPDDGEGKNFTFKLYRATDNSEVTGEVDAIDVDRSRKIGTYQANIPVQVSSPKSKSGEVSLVCKVFGYRKVQHNIDYNKPLSEDVSVAEDNSLLVPFELVRLQKGDISVMYNVYFFSDAGVMRPESRFEINSLVDMMKENPKYKIRIHGHTNGSAVGKIISMGDDKKDFFSLNGTKEGVGTSKELSEKRAEVVREYLIANGIDASRMQIKAWGGKRPIYDKNGVKAQENVRVEIEILEN